jgi:hypothetical protein
MSMWPAALQVLAALAVSAVVFPAQAQQAAVPGAVVAPVAASLQELVRKPLVLRGTLGAEQVQLNVQPKTGEDGLEGKYFIFGQGAQILLAGEVDQNQLVMEESYNGKDVSGEWDGSYQDGVLSGTWSSLDGKLNKSFMLKVGQR